MKPKGRQYTTSAGATVEGTAGFFRPERQARRMEAQKARIASKRILSTNDGEVSESQLNSIEVKVPLVNAKVNRKTGWTVGPIGYGTYRNSLQSMQHQEALEIALQTGAVNVIDCGPNFGLDSESMVGLTLHRLMMERRIDREEIVVVDRIGPLVQGSTLEPVKQRAARGRPFQNMKLLSPELGYCLDPEYIEFQITRSLKALQLDTIDLMLIDTPEVVLPEKPNENVLGQLYRLLQGAMQHLEEEVKRGRIQYYGISSSALSSIHRVGDPRISLDMILRTANTIGDSNKFAAICYPMNILEPKTAHNDTLTIPPPETTIWSKQGRDTSVQLMAFNAGLMQLAYRPVNCLIETKDIFSHISQPSAMLEPNGLLYRLSKPPLHDASSVANLLKATVNGCVAMEKTYALDFVKQTNPHQAPQTDPTVAAHSARVAASGVPHPREFCWAQLILANLSRLDLETLKASWQKQMKPGIQKSVEALRKARPEMDHWATNYERGMNAFYDQYKQALETNRHEELKDLERALSQACPTLDNPSLPAKAVRIVSSTLATTTLVGMRSEEYVYDIVYGGGSPQEPLPMTPLDPSLLGNIFDTGSAHSQTVRKAIRSQLELENEAHVAERKQELEDQIMASATGPRPEPKKP